MGALGTNEKHVHKMRTQTSSSNGKRLNTDRKNGKYERKLSKGELEAYMHHIRPVGGIVSDDMSNNK